MSEPDHARAVRKIYGEGRCRNDGLEFARYKHNRLVSGSKMRRVMPCWSSSDGCRPCRSRLLCRLSKRRDFI